MDNGINDVASGDNAGFSNEGFGSETVAPRKKPAFRKADIKRFTGLEVAEMIGMGDIYRKSLELEGGLPEGCNPQSQPPLPSPSAGEADGQPT